MGYGEGGVKKGKKRKEGTREKRSYHNVDFQCVDVQGMMNCKDEGDLE